MQLKLKAVVKEALWLLLLLAIASVAVNLYRTWDIREQPAPALQGLTLAGDAFDLQQSERPILVHFWASWCPVCKLEESSIQSLSEEHPVITIAMQSGNAFEVQKYLHESQLSFPVILDEFGDLAKSWGVTGVPASFFIGPDNRVRFAEIGYTSELGMRARLALAGL